MVTRLRLVGELLLVGIGSAVIFVAFGCALALCAGWPVSGLGVFLGVS